jgi:hypothetical protein
MYGSIVINLITFPLGFLTYVVTGNRDLTIWTLGPSMLATALGIIGIARNELPL